MLTTRTINQMTLFKFNWSSEKPAQFKRAILPARWIPVQYRDEVLDKVDVWSQGYILMNLPDLLIERIQCRQSVINPYGQLLPSELWPGDEGCEQIFAIIIDDIE